MRKIAVCIFCVLLIGIVFTACESDNGYSSVEAVVVDDALLWMQEEFKAENTTKNALGSQENRPEEIIRIVKHSEEFESAFEEFPIGIDFEEQMLVLYFFTADNIFDDDGNRRYFYEVVDAERNGNVLTVEVDKHKTALLKPGETLPDASVPAQECLAFVIPRMNIDRLKVKINYKDYYKTWQNELIAESEIAGEYTGAATEAFANVAAKEAETGTIYSEKITSKARLDAVFTQFDKAIDFSQNMLVVFCMSMKSDARDFLPDISDIRYEKGVLDIVIGTPEYADGGGKMRIFVMELPQLPVYEINFNMLDM